MQCFFTHTPPAATYTLSLHDALPICSLAEIMSSALSTASPIWAVDSLFAPASAMSAVRAPEASAVCTARSRSEEHTSELQSRRDLVCRLLLEKKKWLHLHVGAIELGG